MTSDVALLAVAVVMPGMLILGLLVALGTLVVTLSQVNAEG